MALRIRSFRSFRGFCAFLGTVLLWFYGNTLVEMIRTRRFLVPLEDNSESIHQVAQNVCKNTENFLRAEAKHFMVDQAHKVVYCRWDIKNIM